MNRLSDNRLTIEYAGETLLAVRTGVQPRRYISQQITAAARRGGVLVKDGRVTPWPVHRVLPVDNEYYLAGPLVSGETLEELLPAAGAVPSAVPDAAPGATAGATAGAAPGAGPAANPPRSAPAWLPSLLAALRFSLENPDYQFCTIRTTLITEENAVLLLDAELARDIVRSIPADQRARIHEPYHDPSLTGAASVVYSAVALLYHALTGVAPQRIDEARTNQTVPIHLLQPRVAAQIATIIDGVLSGVIPATTDALQRIETARRVKGNSWFEEISPEEAERRREAAGQQLVLGSQQRRRRNFWRRNRTRLLVAAVVIFLVGSIPFSIIRSRLQPPRTTGMTPLEIVEGFYRAWNDLDHQFMEDALAAGVARDIVREVTNIYVIDRVQTAHEMRGRFRSPEEWIAEGRPENTVPYGVAHVRAGILHEGEHETTIQVDYEMWRPGQDDQDDRHGQDDRGEVPTILRTHLQDTLELAPTRHAWEITAIRTRVFSEESVPLSNQPPGDGGPPGDGRQSAGD